MSFGYTFRKIRRRPKDIAELTDMAHADGNRSANIRYRIDQGSFMNNPRSQGVQATVLISSGEYVFRTTSSWEAEGSGSESLRRAVQFVRGYRDHLRLLFNQVKVYNQRRCPEMNV